MATLTRRDLRLQVGATPVAFRQVRRRFRVTWGTRPVQRAARTEP
ncbi:hypothetical protein ACQPW1_44295 [Nocardia sp. CA-128927]